MANFVNVVKAKSSLELERYIFEANSRINGKVQNVWKIDHSVRCFSVGSVSYVLQDYNDYVPNVSLFFLIPLIVALVFNNLSLVMIFWFIFVGAFMVFSGFLSKLIFLLLLRKRLTKAGVVLL